MQDSQADYILPEYLLEDITLTQFHHMRVENINSILHHWTQRQAAGEIPFRFKKADRQGKRASAVESAPIGVGPRDQSEPEPQDACDQERERDSGGKGVSESSAKEGPDQQAQDTNSIKFLRLSSSWHMLTFFGIIQAPKTSPQGWPSCYDTPRCRDIS